MLHAGSPVIRNMLQHVKHSDDLELLLKWRPVYIGLNQLCNAASPRIPQALTE